MCYPHKSGAHSDPKFRSDVETEDTIRTPRVSGRGGHSHDEPCEVSRVDPKHGWRQQEERLAHDFMVVRDRDLDEGPVGRQELSGFERPADATR